MYQFILIIHILAAVCLIALVIVQQGKGAAAGAAYGSGASQTVFGSRGSGSFLFRVTLGFVLVFFSTSIMLNYLASRAVKRETQLILPMTPAPEEAPATPATTTPTPSSLPTATRSAVEAAPVVQQPTVKPSAQQQPAAVEKPQAKSVKTVKSVKNVNNVKKAKKQLQ